MLAGLAGHLNVHKANNRRIRTQMDEPKREGLPGSVRKQSVRYPCVIVRQFTHCRQQSIVFAQQLRCRLPDIDILYCTRNRQIHISPNKKEGVDHARCHSAQKNHRKKRSTLRGSQHNAECRPHAPFLFFLRPPFVRVLVIVAAITDFVVFRSVTWLG